MRHRSALSKRLLVWLALCFSVPISSFAQQAPKAAEAQSEPGVAIRRQSNLVVVRVIVRDSQGRPVEGLTKSDFQVLDNKKLQVISQFSVDTPLAEGSIDTKGPEKTVAAANASVESAPRFTALFFDDYHLQFADLVQLREAAKRFLEARLGAGERLALVTSSGHGIVGFTSDREKLDLALSQLQFDSRFQKFSPCPDLTTYQAQLIDDGLDRDALQVGIQMTIACLCNGDPKHCPGPEQYTKNQARQIVMSQDVGAEATLAALENVVKHLAEMPGERRIAMVSDGFLNKNRQYQLDAVVDRALHDNVIINTMDARGLYVIAPGGDLSTRGQQLPTNLAVLYSNMRSTGMNMDSDVLNYAAESTGGIFIQNTNDFEGSLARITSLHETSYVLGFVPENLKHDGRFHALSVKLVNRSHMTLQARRGYFAPRQAEDAAGTLKEEMEQAVFGREDLTGLPMEVQPQFFKRDAQAAKVSIIVRTDVREVKFRKEGDRDLDDITVLLAIFDRDGNLVTSKEETANLRLSDELLGEVMGAGLPLTMKLDLKPGSYVLRTVVRESNSQKIGATSQNLEIP